MDKGFKIELIKCVVTIVAVLFWTWFVFNIDDRVRCLEAGKPCPHHIGILGAP